MEGWGSEWFGVCYDFQRINKNYDKKINKNISKNWCLVIED